MENLCAFSGCQNKKRRRGYCHWHYRACLKDGSLRPAYERPNPWIDGDLAYIPLTQGKTAVIDAADLPSVEPYLWHAIKSTQHGKTFWYCKAKIEGKNVKLHNFILGVKPVDHVDGDGLNNRRSNLRPCNDQMNQQNTHSRGGSSRFKGVSWITRRQRWLVAFRFGGESHFVGYFRDERKAALAYNKAILPLAGEFAVLNEV